MLFKKIGAFVLCILLMCFAFCSCSNDDDATFYWLLDSSPVNLDPQTASKSSEALIIENCFDTLFKRNEKGELVSGPLISYGVSDSGLRYVFRLRDDTYWYKITKGKAEKYAKVKADDYVFAIQRLFTDNRQSSILSTLSYIKNADKVLAGESVSKLSVKVEDEFSFSVVLSRKNDSFLEAFTDYRLSPCCREFFVSTNGRYGLSDDTLVFNGSFFISSMSKSNIKLISNKEHPDGEPECKNACLYLPKDTRQSAALLKSQDIDAAFISAADYDKIKTDENLKFKKETYAVWVLVLNPQSELFSDAELRKAIYYDTDRSAMNLGEVSHLSEQRLLIPDNISVFSQNYRSIANTAVDNAFSPNRAKEFYSKVISRIEAPRLFNIPILIPEGETHKSTFSSLNQIYQRDLSVYFSPVYLSGDEISKKVQSGDFSAALVPVYLNYNSPLCVLESFSQSASGVIFPFINTQFDLYLSRAKQSPTAADAAANYSAAEKILLESAEVIPLYTENKYFAYGKNTSGFVTTFSGEILFRDIVKK